MSGLGPTPDEWADAIVGEMRRVAVVRAAAAPAAEPSSDARLVLAIEAAERKAWDSLAKYKFVMFGYWAGQWVLLNRVGDLKRPNPFASLVRLARIVAAP